MRSIRHVRPVAFGLTPVILLSLGAIAPDLAYRNEVAKWRLAHESNLKADDGWLTVVGLFWLRDGANSVGSAPGSDVRLPAAGAPARVGVIRLSGGEARFEAAPDVDVRLNGQPARSGLLRVTAPGGPDQLTLGSLTMFVIKRGNRFAVRLRDADSELRRQFKGLEWYPVNERYRVTARFVPYSPPKRVRIQNVLGMLEDYQSPGYVAFKLNGRELRLDPVQTGGNGSRLFFILKDQTAGNGTYPAGRFLYADLPRSRMVVLDFNKAENPPCAFTPHATCPLPPRQNVMPTRIDAGERYSEHH